VSLPVLASEAIEKTIWYPTILGFLVVVAAIVLFVGSIYLLLSTDVGARLGFLVVFTGLMGFMVVLTSLWLVTASPLNTLKGRIPGWEAVEVTKDLERAKTEEVRNIQADGKKVSTIEAANVKAAADENLIQVEALPSEAQVTQQAFARFQAVTNYQVLNTYEIGGSKPNPLDFELTHTPLFAVVEFCEVVPGSETVPFGVAPPPSECKAGSDQGGFLVLKRDLGSLRVPPFVAWIASILLFGLGLLLLHWREKDQQAVKAQAESTTDTATPVPVNA
jgi:DNA-binding transcriptional regulator YiaG